MGSLFDGSGGFPLGAALNGIKPVWASEIEPYPMRVTAARLPDMVQLGDVTKVDGAAIEPVDIITFGSPCQDLSVAGKQAGIHEGARSSLFFEAIRIIKEMRSRVDRGADQPVRPRWAVWENVPGAFSSHNGNDFRAVLQALASVAGCQVPIPRPEGGGWKQAGAIVGDGWSIAWRVFDAQYWGVPQRRKRIYLVADFGGERAGEVLFEREGVRGNPETCTEAGQVPAAHAERSAGGSGGAWTYRGRNGGCNVEMSHEISYCLRDPSGGGSWPNICYIAAFMGGYAGESCIAFKERAGKPGGGKGILPAVGRAFTLAANVNQNVCYPAVSRSLCARHDSSPCVDRGQPFVCYDCRGNGNGQTVPTLTGDHMNRITDYTSVVCRRTHYSEFAQDGTTSTLKARDCKQVETDLIVEKSPTRKYIVRRLTPLECCRLQGFPDWWEDGVEGSDSARYKMWGNGVALPCVERVMYGIRKVEGQ